MQNILKKIKKLPAYEELKAQLKQGKGEQAAFGLVGTHKTALICSLLTDLSQAAIVVTNEEKQALIWQEDLQALLPDWDVCYFPKKDIKLQRLLLADSYDTTRYRLQSLKSLMNREQVIVLTTIEAVMEALPAPKSFEELSIVLTNDTKIELYSLINILISAGYKRVTQVEGYSQFSVRGDIVDIYPLLTPHPVRIEFFGDEVDSIRYFDPGDQRTIAVIDSIELNPASEYCWPLANMEKGVAVLQADIAKSLKINPDSPMKERWYEDLEQLKQGSSVAGFEQFSAYFTELDSFLFDYAAYKPLIIWDEPARLAEKSNWRMTELIDDNNLLPRQQYSQHSYSRLIANANKSGNVLTISLLSRQIKHHNPVQLHTFAARQAPTFHGQINFLIQELNRWSKQNYSVVITSSDRAKLQGLADQIQDSGLEALVVDRLPENISVNRILLTEGNLRQGFEVPELRFVMLTEQEVFGTRKVLDKKRRKIKKDSRKSLLDYRELSPGDYIVHISHGIGVYQGLKTMEINGVHRDYLGIRYKGEDRLYVPVDQIHLVQKYVGSEGRAPRLYSLGNSEWQRVKSRVKASVQQMAQELLKLYAKRESISGVSYPQDDKWQLEFEKSFPFEETPDQLRAVKEIKQDMVSSSPMDRLLCGDVGYGKTEVALRAVFKAAMAGKQVAILVPTTILAHQHFRTITTRLVRYPINVAMLSRFRSRKDNTKTIEGIRAGSVDIVIGTHALLQDRVKFKDLGLLVIDEEQRFGVAHKEKIKQLKANVDVLTLSATPIPRTLHMSMVGMRDLSMIETPPENRYPVQTYVVEYEPNLVVECISREIARDGQVYYLHNRVKDIELTAAKLQQLLPEARIAVGHGRMTERHLEQIMIDFYNHEYDILVSTTIIESGLDIPNVNTLIIEDADKFGLAQLYQLRGRVGRTNRLAYAYLTYRKNKVLTEVAEKRLNAIREFTELGAGFKIALRDLQIRGTGNILGPEQSGFMMQVGYDLYVQLLEESLKELKGEIPAKKFEVDIDLGVDAYIPNRYIKDNKVKIEMYKKIVASENREQIQDITDELLDRFGNPPLPVRNLLLISEIKAALKAIKVKSLVRKKHNVKATFCKEAVIKPNSIQKLWELYGQQIQLNSGKEVGLQITVKNDDVEQLLRELNSMFKDLVELEESLTS